MANPRSIDLNSDLGESFGPWRMGDDTAMLSIVTSANIACGGHAGDAETMFVTLREAAKQGVTVGAHPGYADMPGFGRRVLSMSAPEIERMVATQIGALMGAAALAGVPVRYVKAHGALANLAAAERAVADAVAGATRAIDRNLALLAISGTQLETAGNAANLQVFAEVFADRAYRPDGQLVSRQDPDAMLNDADVASQRLIAWLETGLMPTVGGQPIRLAGHSICVHGDNPNAVALAEQLRQQLQHAGVNVAAFLPAT